jgi:hypothetical protein
MDMTEFPIPYFLRVRARARPEEVCRSVHYNIAGSQIVPRGAFMRYVAALTVLLSASISTRAALNPEADKPYQLQVVIRFGSHSWLGEQFRDDLRRDLGGMLKDAVGGIAEVTVIDLKKVPANEWQPIWKEADTRGLAELKPAAELTGIKTHFLRVDFVNGQYELLARQQDGSTGMVSQLRHEHTPDRALVTRLAARLIGRDFGLVGTVLGQRSTGTVTFKGGSLAPSLDRWAHKGDVLALYGILPPSGGTSRFDRGERAVDSIIQLTDEPKNGAAPCRVIHRGEFSPLDRRGSALGFRCIKIAATTGPMRLRLVDERGRPHNRAVQVRVHAHEFKSGESPDEEVLNPDRDGVFVSKKLYENMCFVRVVTGARAIAQMPVEIEGERVVTVQVGLSAGTEQAGELQFRHAELRRMYDESEWVFVNGWNEVSALTAKGKFPEALKRAHASRAALEEDLRQLSDRTTQLRKEIGNQGISLADCDDKAIQLARDTVRFNQQIGRLEEHVAILNDPGRKATEKKLNEMYAKARSLAASNDYDGAIALFEQILGTKEFGEQPQIKKEHDELVEAWRIKGDDHRASRDFVYKDWAAVKNSNDIADKLPTARSKMQMLVKFKDQLTLLKLRSTLVEIGKLLREEIKNADQDDKVRMDKLKKLAGEFDGFVKEVEGALSSQSASK